MSADQNGKFQVTILKCPEDQGFGVGVGAPVVVATSQESESESQSFSLPRPQLQEGSQNLLECILVNLPASTSWNFFFHISCFFLQCTMPGKITDAVVKLDTTTSPIYLLTAYGVIHGNDLDFLICKVVTIWDHQIQALLENKLKIKHHFCYFSPKLM